MIATKRKLRTIKIRSKSYGDLDGSKFFVTEALYKELEAKKLRSGQSLLRLFELGRAVRGFKHLLEQITRKNATARLILTEGKTCKVGDDYHINLKGYSSKGRSSFLVLYRSTALAVSSTYLAEQFPYDFPKPNESMSDQEMSKAAKNFDRVLDELAQKKKHKTQILKKTSSVIQQLRAEARSLKQHIAVLEELKRQSSIAVYIERVDELRSRLKKNYKETSGKNSWQSWIYANSWVMGIQYLPPIQKERVGFNSIPDYLFPTLDGFIDILEVKLPTDDVIKPDPSHPGSYAWSPEANKAIGQVVNYLYFMELNQLQLKDKINRKYAGQLNREINLIRPRAFILIGMEDNWDAETKEAFRKLNHTLHGIEVITYTAIVKRGEHIIDLYS